MLYNIFLATKNTKYTKDYEEVKRHKGKSFGFFLRESNDEVGIVSFSKSLFITQIGYIIYPNSASLMLRIAGEVKTGTVGF